MTTKIYFVRHQAAGVVSKYPFAEPPTEEQITAVCRECEPHWGAEHPKTGEAYWAIPVEAELLGPTDIPKPPEPEQPSAESAAAMPQFVASGTGTVTPQTISADEAGVLETVLGQVR